jgi:hypothetical protein
MFDILYARVEVAVLPTRRGLAVIIPVILLVVLLCCWVNFDLLPVGADAKAGES